MITELWLNAETTSIHPSIKCSPRSSRYDEEFETYQDFDCLASEDPLQSCVPVKRELLSPVNGLDSALDVKPNISRLEANLMKSPNPAEVTSSSEQAAFKLCEKLGINASNFQLVERADTEEEGDVDVDASDSSDSKRDMGLCKECGLVLTNTVNRLRHRCRKFKCDSCGWRGLSRSMLQAHRLEEHEYRPHVCLQCKARFATERSVRLHARMHAKGTTTCACQTCGANFNTVLNLSRHLRQCRARTLVPYAEDKKPFLCRLCLATFWNHADVQRHVKTVHTLKQPFRCHVCVASFATQRSLDAHINQVHRVPRPFTCSVCFARFSLREELLDHLQVHLVSKKGRSTSADKKTPAAAIKKEVGDDSSKRRSLRSSTGSSTGSSRSSTGTALDNIKTYVSDSE